MTSNNTSSRSLALTPFNLLRWYSVTNLLVILPVSGLLAFAFARFVAHEMLYRDAILTAQFITSMVQTESTHGGLASPLGLTTQLDPRIHPAGTAHIDQRVEQVRAEFFDHVRTLPDVLLVNIYKRDGSIIWSNNRELIGTRAHEQEELHEAFTTSEPVARVHLGTRHDRPEQQFTREPRSVFVENYIPLVDGSGEVAAVVEIYKEPESLLQTIERGERIIWGATVLAAALLYLAGFRIVQRGQRLLLHQQQRLMESETLAVVGEMSTAVAHSLRNPLAAIRTSAELALDSSDDAVRGNARDIITQVDRLSSWVRDLLRYSRPQETVVEAVDVAAALREAVSHLAQQLQRAGVQVEGPGEAEVPRVVGNGILVAQALRSVLANAIEAMPSGGRLHVAVREAERGQRVEVEVRDTGQGMSQSQLQEAMRPFHTTKRTGVGLGLAIVRQVMDRFGGQVTIDSEEQVGTTVRLVFARAGARGGEA